MAEQVKTKIQVKMKLLDDVFHRVIIALERLETFLEIHRNGEDAAKFATTGMHGERDLHDDQKNPPTLESMLGEVQLQCSALFFQTGFDDEKLFVQTMKYFMPDLLEWYGGRCKWVAGREIPYDKVEACVLPVIVSLSRQVESVTEIMQVFGDYVTKLKSIGDLSPDEKAEAVKKGFETFLVARNLLGEQLQEFVASGEKVELSVHRRGTALDGYKRLIDAMLKLYDTTTPAKRVRDMFNAYVEGLPEFTDDDLKLMASVGNGQDTQSRGQEDKGQNQGVNGIQQTPNELQKDVEADALHTEQDDKGQDQESNDPLQVSNEIQKDVDASALNTEETKSNQESDKE